MTLPIFIGYDARDDIAAKVCRDSLLAHASIPLNIQFLRDRDLRRKRHYFRPYVVDEFGQMHDAFDGAPFSTEFSFSRFLVPHLLDYAPGLALFVDADFLFRADIADMIVLAENEPEKSIYCVQHHQQERQFTKMDGVMQLHYFRKNWSSLMLFRPERCKPLTRYVVNNQSGRYLHGLLWCDERDIGAIPHEWNYLAGYMEPPADPKAVHYTGGTPDMAHAIANGHDSEWWSYANKYRADIAYVSAGAVGT